MGERKYNIICCNNLNNFGSLLEKLKLKETIDIVIICIKLLLQNLKLDVAELLRRTRRSSSRQVRPRTDLPAKELLHRIATLLIPLPRFPMSSTILSSLLRRHPKPHP
ncbi:hypothetical protein DsansV1_C02g0013481 [Dioscorea sansibarensis]